MTFETDFLAGVAATFGLPAAEISASMYPAPSASELKHAVIEQAKASYRAPGCDMAFEECLAFHAESMVQPPRTWRVGERNGGWTIDIEDPTITT